MLPFAYVFDNAQGFIKAVRSPLVALCTTVHAYRSIFRGMFYTQFYTSEQKKETIYIYMHDKYLPVNGSRSSCEARDSFFRDFPVILQLRSSSVKCDQKVYAHC